MASLAKILSPVLIELNDLLLDPNNPRFSELGEDLNPIPENRFSEERVQSNTLEKMKADTFAVSELKDTIKTVGFLPMDRIVVRKWKSGGANNSQKFVVVEGNRRVTALKWLLALHEAGKETFDADQLENFSMINSLLLDDSVAPDSALLILPGLRHVSGIKEWGPYQKAKTVHALRKSGMGTQEAAQSLGLSTRAANNAYRCFLALEQMKADEEYGEAATPKMYSYFEEAFKRAEVKNWLNWDDAVGQFVNTENRAEFYSWMVPDPETGDSAKLPEAKSIRDFARIVSDEESMAVLRGPSGTLVRALGRYEAEHPEDWYPKVLAAESAIKALTPAMLRSMDANAQTALSRLKVLIEESMRDRNLLGAQ